MQKKSVKNYEKKHDRKKNNEIFGIKTGKKRKKNFGKKSRKNPSEDSGAYYRRTLREMF